jgi:predicted metal-dependent peptidase
MKKLKTFENFKTQTEINVIVDTSASISNDQLRNAIDDIKEKCEQYCDKINVIQVSDYIDNVTVINNLSNMLYLTYRFGAGGSDLYAAIEYIIDNDLNDNKTYIISDFILPKIDFSELSDYEKIVVE